MASTGLQLVGFILGVISWIGMIGTCASPEWRKNSHGQTLIDSTLRYDGLWVRCKAFPTGQTNCDDYKAFFIGLPVVLQVCRALMIAAIGLGCIAVLVTVLGIKCTSIGGSHPRTKAKVAMVGGLLFGVAGNLVTITLIYAYQWTVNEHYSLMKAFYFALASSIAGNASGLTLVAGSCLQVGLSVSLYASCVSTKCFDHLQMTGVDVNLTFEPGPGLYGGWTTMVTSLWSAILLIVYDDYWCQNLRSIAITKTREIDKSKIGELDGVSGVYREHGSMSGSLTRNNGTNDSSQDNMTSQSTISYPSTGSTTHAPRMTERIKPMNDRSSMNVLRTFSYNTNTDSNTLSTSDELLTKSEWKDTTSTQSVSYLITTHL